MRGKNVLDHIEKASYYIEKADKVCGYLITDGKADDKRIVEAAGVNVSLWDIIVSLKNFAEREKSRYEQALNEAEVNV